MRNALHWVAVGSAAPVVALAAASWVHALWGVLEKGRRAAVLAAVAWTVLAVLVVGNVLVDGIVAPLVTWSVVAGGVMLGSVAGWRLILHARQGV